MRLKHVNLYSVIALVTFTFVGENVVTQFGSFACGTKHGETILTVKGILLMCHK